MIERIKQLLDLKNLSASQFADNIGVQRSSVSHVLSGRNKPSLEFVQKILLAFPEISSDWILFGKGSITKQNNLFNSSSRKEEHENISLPRTESNQQLDQTEDLQSEDFEMIPGNNHQSDSLINESLDRLTKLRQKKVTEKIVILYKDQTFSEYYPES